MHHNGAVPTPDPDQPGALAAWLAGPESSVPIASADEAIGAAAGDPVAAAEILRRGFPALEPALASAALEQAELRRLARHRYGIDANALLLTRDGLEQATRPEVAAHRAAQLRTAGANRVLDLTGGLGFDASALAAAGLEVTTVESDDVTAVFLAHNCPDVRVINADATQSALVRDLIEGLDDDDVVFVDPARRDSAGPRGAGLRARPERDPARWSPPWPWVEALPHHRIAAKVAPSFRAPANWHAEWVSVHRTVVECALFSWPVFPAARRATIWTADGPIVVDAVSGPPSSGGSGPGEWLHEPDPAILRAGAVDAVLHDNIGLWSVDDESTWLASDSPIDVPYLRSFAVIEQLHGSTTSQRRQLDRLGVDVLTVKSKDVGVAPHSVLRDLDRREGNDHVLVVTRRSGRAIRLLCRPALMRSA